MIKQNNPGNIRPTSIAWLGECGVKNGFCVYDTELHGIRALAIDLYNANVWDGYKSIAAITNHYAPPFQNNSVEYASIVSKATGVIPSDPISLQDRDIALNYIRGVIIAENGYSPSGAEWYPEETIKDAMNLAKKWEQWS